MSRVGVQGGGESVWLAWFECSILERFAAVAEKRGETDRARRWRDSLGQRKGGTGAGGGDGAWDRGAHSDDGTPLGSATGEECRIDSIGQSWAVLSGAGDPTR